MWSQISELEQIIQLFQNKRADLMVLIFMVNPYSKYLFFFFNFSYSIKTSFLQLEWQNGRSCIEFTHPQFIRMAPISARLDRAFPPAWEIRKECGWWQKMLRFTNTNAKIILPDISYPRIDIQWADSLSTARVHCAAPPFLWKQWSTTDLNQMLYKTLRKLRLRGMAGNIRLLWTDLYAPINPYV